MLSPLRWQATPGAHMASSCSMMPPAHRSGPPRISGSAMFQRPVGDRLCLRLTHGLGSSGAGGGSVCAVDRVEIYSAPPVPEAVEWGPHYTPGIARPAGDRRGSVH